MSPKKWKLLSKKDVSPHSWFPIEMRSYELPNGKQVDDFSVATFPDVSQIIPVTTDQKIVLVRQFKAGINEVILEFPAGRHEPYHRDMRQTALHELEEETGIRAHDIELFGKVAPFVSKATEKVYCYLARDVEFNSVQNFDENEDIEVVIVSFEELETLIATNEIQAAVTIAGWDLAKRKYAQDFSEWSY